MDLKRRVETILRDAGVFPASEPGVEITIEDGGDGSVIVRRRFVMGINVSPFLGKILKTHAEILSDAGLQVAEDPEDGQRPPSLRVTGAP